MKEVYNTQLIDVNLRVEISYGEPIEPESGDIVQEDFDIPKEKRYLCFEFHSKMPEFWEKKITQKNANKKLKTSFLTMDTSVHEGELTRSERPSPFDEEIARIKKGDFLSKAIEEQDSEEMSSYGDSDMRLINSRSLLPRGGLPTVNEVESQERVESEIEALPSTRRELLEEDREELEMLEREVELGSVNFNILGEGRKKVIEKNKRNFEILKNKESFEGKENFKSVINSMVKDEEEKNLSHEYKSPINDKSSGIFIERKIQNYINSSIEGTVKFNSIHQSTPKLPNLPKSTQILQSSKNQKKIKAASEINSKGLAEVLEEIKSAGKKNPGEFSFQDQVKTIQFNLSNKKPKLKFDKITISPERMNKPQEPVKNKVEEKLERVNYDPLPQPKFE
jgi:hypothetical protein